MNVVIVGRPNVGKSSLFNRLLGRKRALVLDVAGVTRDRIVEPAKWWVFGEQYDVNLIDTGGLGEGRFMEEIAMQVATALQEAAVVLFVMDIRAGLTIADEEVFLELRKAGLEDTIPVIGVLNKADNESFEDDLHQFYKLGLDHLMTVSAEHALGIDDLKDTVMRITDSIKAPDPEAEAAAKERAYYAGENSAKGRRVFVDPRSKKASTESEGEEISVRSKSAPKENSDEDDSEEDFPATVDKYGRPQPKGRALTRSPEASEEDDSDSVESDDDLENDEDEGFDSDESDEDYDDEFEEDSEDADGEDLAGEGEGSPKAPVGNALTVAELEKEVPDEYVPRTPAIAIVGQPNVGKSTMLNAICGEKRAIVSPIAGTTVDSIDTKITWRGRDYLLIDTAGIRRKNKTEQGIEVLSVVQSRKTLDRADLALLVLDGEKGVHDQDEKIAGLIEEAGCSVIIVLNKWDTQANNKEFSQKLAEEQVRKQIRFLGYAPIVFTTAKDSLGLDRLHRMMEMVLEQRTVKIPTRELTEFVRGEVDRHNPFNAKFYFVHQAGRNPPTFVAHVNDPRKIHFSMSRHLVKLIRQGWGFSGSPIRFHFLKAKNSGEKK
jgi:small GTP-binding protein